ncbi:hypothetical protein HDU76_013381 [Blyttiomyces sp. JEL0837]|nr:hypothetical protein HDU76_013381 [Blyttiomyces sp. JEL0837]
MLLQSFPSFPLRITAVTIFLIQSCLVSTVILASVDWCHRVNGGDTVANNILDVIPLELFDGGWFAVLSITMASAEFHIVASEVKAAALILPILNHDTVRWYGAVEIVHDGHLSRQVSFTDDLFPYTTAPVSASNSSAIINSQLPSSDTSRIFVDTESWFQAKDDQPEANSHSHH